MSVPRSARSPRSAFDAYNGLAWNVFVNSCARSCGTCGKPFGGGPEEKKAHACEGVAARPSWLPRCLPKSFDAKLPETDDLALLARLNGRDERSEASANVDPWGHAIFHTFKHAGFGPVTEPLSRSVLARVLRELRLPADDGAVDRFLEFLDVQSADEDVLRGQLVAFWNGEHDRLCRRALERDESSQSLAIDPIVATLFEEARLTNAQAPALSPRPPEDRGLVGPRRTTSPRGRRSRPATPAGAARRS